MNSVQKRVVYFIVYSCGAFSVFFFCLQKLELSKLPEIVVLTFFLAGSLFLEAPLPRLRTTFLLIYPFYVLNVLMLRDLSVFPVFLAYLIQSPFFFKSLRSRGWNRIVVLVWNTLRMGPVLFASSILFQKFGGGSFLRLQDVPWLAFALMVFCIAILDGIGLNTAVALLESKPLWKLHIPLVQFIDFPFSPLAIPVYLFYESEGVKALFIFLFPFIGGMWVMRQLFHESSKKQESMELLNVANELIEASLNFDEMIQKISERIRGLLNADGVEVFLKNSGGWKVEKILGKSPWEKAKPDLESIGMLDKMPAGVPVIIRDIHAGGRFLQYQASGLFSILVIPLSSGKELIGAIVCSSVLPFYFFSDHLEFAKVLMGQVSSALLGAQLHERLAETLEELKRTEAQLIQSEKMAGLGKLVAGVAHELNNPLNFLSMQLPVLEEKVLKQQELLEIYGSYEQALPEEDRALLSKLKEATDLCSLKPFYAKLFNALREGTSRAKQIVSNLRIFARAETVGEGADYSWDYADVNEALESTLMILTPMHDGRVDLHKNYGNIPKLWCSPQQLNQVFMNVLSNAFEAIEGNGEVWLETGVKNGTISIAVTDNGKGIPEEIQKRIFEPFFTTKEVGKGTGLGLSIVYGIVSRHKGEIQLESKEGRGTSVSLTFPIHAGNGD